MNDLEEVNTKFSKKFKSLNDKICEVIDGFNMI